MEPIYITAIVLLILGLFFILGAIPLFIKGWKITAYWLFGIGLFLLILVVSLFLIGSQNSVSDVMVKSIGGGRMSMIQTLTKIY